MPPCRLIPVYGGVANDQQNELKPFTDSADIKSSESSHSHPPVEAG